MNSNKINSNSFGKFLVDRYPIGLVDLGFDVVNVLSLGYGES